MKVILSIASVCLVFSTWFVPSDAAVPMDFRYKMRRPPPPPPPPRSPSLPQYINKWQQRRPIRGSLQHQRPIPLQIVSTFVQPPVINVPLPRPTPAPLRTYWKTTNAPIPPKQEPPFQSSQPMTNLNEYDYHIQTNNIPTNTITIKQVGEKGPIHTIPAPNLSLADKPIVVEEVKQQQSFGTQREQYQVNEFNNVYQQGQQVYIPQSQVINLQDGNNNSPLSTREIYEIINTHMHQQNPQQNYNSPQNPNHNYQDMLQQDQNVQPIVYNYQRNSQSDAFPTTYITADYNIKTGDSEEGTDEDPGSSNSQNNIVFGNKAVENDSNQRQIDADFYTTLPNQKVAQALASLQSAGQINHNLNQFGQNVRNGERIPLEIYVPDLEPSNNQDNSEYVRDRQISKNQVVFKDSNVEASIFNGVQQVGDQFGAQGRKQS